MDSYCESSMKPAVWKHWYNLALFSSLSMLPSPGSWLTQHSGIISVRILSHPCPPHPTQAKVPYDTSHLSLLLHCAYTADTHYTKTVLLAPLKTLQLLPNAYWRKTKRFRQACDAFCDLVPTHITPVSTMALLSSSSQSLAGWFTMKYEF